MAGIKHDSEKESYADFLLDFKEPLHELYKVWKFGRDTYGLGNWKHLDNGYKRFQNALIRHFFKDGMSQDDETGLLHAAHMAFNCLAMTYYSSKNIAFDDIITEDDNLDTLFKEIGGN